MSLIITNNKTLKDTAIISIKHIDGEVKENIKGDLTLLEVNGEVAGINVFNYTKYFKAEEGAHTLNKEQIEAIAKLGYNIEDDRKSFVIGEVIEREVHPKSERLFILKVKADKELQIVTNAANAELGKQVVVANVGTVLPSGTPIKLGKVMGIESQGMLCGGETLGKEITEGVLIVSGNNGDEYIL